MFDGMRLNTIGRVKARTFGAAFAFGLMVATLAIGTACGANAVAEPTLTAVPTVGPTVANVITSAPPSTVATLAPASHTTSTTWRLAGAVPSQGCVETVMLTEYGRSWMLSPVRESGRA